jgi:hypothetical protein
MAITVKPNGCVKGTETILLRVDANPSVRRFQQGDYFNFSSSGLNVASKAFPSNILAILKVDVAGTVNAGDVTLRLYDAGSTMVDQFIFTVFADY